MRKWLFLVGLALFIRPQYLSAANEDNRRLGGDYYRQLLSQVDENQVILFSTNITALLPTTILPDHSVAVTSVTWPNLVNYSTTPARLNGGRMFAAFQAVATSTNTPAVLYWSLDDGCSITTNPYLTNGQWWPPADWPFVWQSSVTVRSTSAYTINGFIITDKKR